MAKKLIRIRHKPTGTLLAEGPIGWGITPFEGNYYVRKKYMKTHAFRPNFIPGICSYKFLYVWMDLKLSENQISKNLGWLYWLPNPLFPFIWYRIGLPGNHPDLEFERFDQSEQVRNSI